MQQGIIITSLVLFSEPAFPGACEHSCGFGLKLLSHNSEKKKLSQMVNSALNDTLTISEKRH